MSVYIFVRHMVKHSTGGAYELRTKFRLGGTYRGLYRVLRGPYQRIYYKFSPGLIWTSVSLERCAS